MTDGAHRSGPVPNGHEDLVATARLVLQPFPAALARAVIGGDINGFHVAVGYPHPDTFDIARGVIDEPEPSTTSTWIITRKADGAIVGDCGWFDVSDAEDAVEIGYGLAETARHQGFATEAVGALLGRVWSIGVARVVATTHEDNRASARVLERLGFRQCESDGDHRRYERFRPDNTGSRA